MYSLFCYSSPLARAVVDGRAEPPAAGELVCLAGELVTDDDVLHQPVGVRAGVVVRQPQARDHAQVPVEEGRSGIQSRSKSQFQLKKKCLAEENGRICHI